MKKEVQNKNCLLHCRLWSLSLLFGLLSTLPVSASVVATQNCRELSLDFVPYVSSYLPKPQGPLTNLKGNIKSLADLSSPPTERQLEIFKRTSVMERIDLLNRTVLGKQTQRQAETHASHYKPKQPSWAGYCEFWSAAASNPEINQFLQKTGDLKCGDVILTKGEIRELVTGFANDKDNGIFGNKSVTERSLEAHAFRNASGFDDLSADTFDLHLLGNLRQNTALVMDLDPGPEVWNHPIFRARRCEAPVPNAAAFAQGELAIPPRLLSSPNPQVRQFLQGIHEADLLAQKLQFKEAVPLLQRSLKGLTLNPEFAQREGLFLDRDYKHLRKRAAAALDWLRQQGHAILHPDYSLQLVSSTVVYRIESDFAMGTVDDKNDDLTRQKTLTYVLVKKAGQESGPAVDQFWVTEASYRPDSIWLPARTGGIRDQSEVLRDLADAIERCQSLQRN